MPIGKKANGRSLASSTFMNVEVKSCDVVTDRLVVFEFENGISMHLEDSSDQYESMQISFEGDPTLWVV